jgi:hypothetical protein
MVDLRGMLAALWNMITMSSEERAERWARVFVSKQIYDDGQLLERLAERIGGEFEEETHRFLWHHDILNASRTWPLVEANAIHAGLETRLDSAYKTLLEDWDGSTPLPQDLARVMKEVH